jgi:hypothetical protein
MLFGSNVSKVRLFKLTCILKKYPYTLCHVAAADTYELTVDGALPCNERNAIKSFTSSGNAEDSGDGPLLFTQNA